MRMRFAATFLAPKVLKDFLKTYDGKSPYAIIQLVEFDLFSLFKERELKSENNNKDLRRQQLELYCQKRFTYLLEEERGSLLGRTTEDEFESMLIEIEKYYAWVKKRSIVKSSSHKTLLNEVKKIILNLKLNLISWNLRQQRFIKIVSIEKYQKYNFLWLKKLLSTAPPQDIELEKNWYTVNDENIKEFYGSEEKGIEKLIKLIRKYLESTLQRIRRFQMPDERFDFVQLHLRNISFLSDRTELTELKEISNEIDKEKQQIEAAERQLPEDEEKLLDFLALHDSNFENKDDKRFIQIVLHKIATFDASWLDEKKKQQLKENLRRSLKTMQIRMDREVENFVINEIPLIENVIRDAQNSESMPDHSDILTENFFLFAIIKYIDDLRCGIFSFNAVLEKFIRRIFSAGYFDVALNQIIDILQKSKSKLGSELLESLPLRGLELGAGRGIAACHYKLGGHYYLEYLKKDDSKQDLERALDHYERGISDPRCRYKLAKRYYQQATHSASSFEFRKEDLSSQNKDQYTDDQEKKFIKTIRLYKKAKSNGHLKSFYELGEFYEKNGFFYLALAEFQQLSQVSTKASNNDQQETEVCEKAKTKLVNADLWYQAALQHRELFCGIKQEGNSNYQQEKLFHFGNSLLCFKKAVGMFQERKAKLEKEHHQILMQRMTHPESAIIAMDKMMHAAKTACDEDKIINDANNPDNSSDYQLAVRHALTKVKEKLQDSCWEAARFCDKTLEPNKTYEDVLYIRTLYWKAGKAGHLWAAFEYQKLDTWSNWFNGIKRDTCRFWWSVRHPFSNKFPSFNDSQHEEQTNQNRQALES